jgi:hypothetical protein
MPQILIITDEPEADAEIVYREHVASVHLEAEQSGMQLVERLGWAVSDALEAERRTRLGRLRSSDDGLRAA